MSVEKMNYYKEQKAHRKENLAKEKRRKKAIRAAWIGGGVAVLAAVIAAIGLTGYNSYKAAEAAKPDYSVTSQVVEDLSGVLQTEAAEEVTDETAVETEAAETEAAETEAAETEAAEETEAAATEAAETTAAN